MCELVNNGGGGPTFKASLNRTVTASADATSIVKL